MACINLDQVQFVLAILREIERQNPFLFTELIREWQFDNKVSECYFVHNNDHEILKEYIIQDYELETYSGRDKYITIDGTNERIVTFDDIQEYFDLEYMARDIVENRLGKYYLERFLPH